MPPVSSFAAPLMIAGFALAAAGIGLRRMPFALRVVAAAAGVAVALWGASLTGSEPATTARRASPAALATPGSNAPPASAPSIPVLTATVAGTVQLARGLPLAEQPVVLHRFERTSETETLSTTTGPDGAFAFPTQQGGPMVGFRVTVEYQGAEFGSDVLLPSSGPLDAITLTVAPSTIDSDGIRIISDSTTVVGDSNQLQALHVLTVQNSKQTAYIGGLRLPVLPGAVGFEPRQGLDRTRLEIADDEVISGRPVLPGRTEIVYLYAAPVGSRGVTLRRTTAYATDRLTVLTSGPLRARGLRPQSEVNIAGRTYHRWTQSDVGSGTRIDATLGAADRGGIWRAAIIVAAALAALAVLAIGFIRRRRNAADANSSMSPQAEIQP